jgi:integrase
MTLFRRGHVWWTGFYINGKRFQESTGTNNRRQAEDIERKIKSDRNLESFGIATMDPQVTFATLADEFEKKAETSIFHTGRLKWIKEFFGEMPVRTITKNTVSEYRQLRQSRDGPLKDSTLNRDIAVMRRVLYWAQEQGLIAVNPMARVPMVRERRIKKPVLSIAHEDLILHVAKPHMRDMIIAGIDTGLRRGELFKQQWEDIDLDHGILYVTRSKTAEGDAREIPLSHRLAEVLRVKAKKCSTGSVFTFQGHPVHDLKRSWETAQRDAKLPLRYRFHDLRHTFATRLMLAGVIQDIRMALMGHEPRTVHWGYTHVELTAKREAIRKLEAWQKKQRKEKRPKQES